MVARNLRRRTQARSGRARRERGFAYLRVLAAVAVIGVGLLAVSEVWVASARRQRMAELDWIGAQFTGAIGSYYQSTPGQVKVYPARLEDLVEDRRYVTMRRHLRRVYTNPFSGQADWRDGRCSGRQGSRSAGLGAGRRRKSREGVRV